MAYRNVADQLCKILQTSNVCSQGCRQSNEKMAEFHSALSRAHTTRELDLELERIFQTLDRMCKIIQKPLIRQFCLHLQAVIEGEGGEDILLDSIA